MQTVKYIGNPRTLAFAVLACVCLVPGGRANDWPTYRRDNARSGITAETLAPPLTGVWVFQPRHSPEAAWEAPRTEPVEGIRELDRVQFDDTYHVVVAGDAVYFGSSADNKVYCLDAGTGQVRWTRITGGPIRLAPALSDGRVYVGSDDGVAYCLDGASGKTIWKRRTGPSARQLLGHGKMISRWPLRTGILVDDGVAYWGAGIWPTEGVYIEAVNAADGTPLWRNDMLGEATETYISPQGYLLATKTTLFVPQGRASPVAHSRQDGRVAYTARFGKTIGGAFALIAGDVLYTGTEEVMSYRQDTRERFAWFDGRQVVVTADVSYVATDTTLAAIDRTAYRKPSLQRFSLRDQRTRVARELNRARRTHDRAVQALTQQQDTIAALDKDIAELKKAGQAEPADAAPRQRQTAVTVLETRERSVAEAKAALDPMQAQMDELDQRWEQAGSGMQSGRLWQVECPCPDALILAGDILFAGGQDRVVAVDSKTGKQVWEAAVHGKAKGLAVAAGRLFVSTDQGPIYCFVPGKSDTAPLTITEPVVAAPFPQDTLTPVYAAAADHIVAESGITRGYCLVLGCESGRLAYELAQRTELRIYGIEPDAAKVAAARAALDAAGVYGTRICIEQGDPTELPYADYFATLVVSESALLGKLDGISAAEALRVLKPCGGVLMIGQPALARDRTSGLAPEPLGRLLQTDGMSVALTHRDGIWAHFARGPLPGAGNWTHLYADAGNTACGYDYALKCPLGLLWFGDPGPLHMISRHRSAAGPLTVNGVLFVQGEHVVMAYDAYNGLKLWEHPIPNVVRDAVSRDCGNLAADTESFFVSARKQCLRLDAGSGKVLHTYKLPEPADERSWGYTACDGGVLFGSRTAGSRESDALFAMDVATGQHLWTHTGRSIHHQSIAVEGGRIFFVDDNIATDERRTALQARLKGLSPKAAEEVLKTAPVRTLFCLDTSNGKVLWEQPIDLTGGIGGLYWSALGTMAREGVLVVFGVYRDGHYWKEFFAGQFESRRVLVLSAENGHKLWEKTIGYRVRPLIIGDTLHAEPWAFDLRTGRQITRINPITGIEEAWQFARPGHHCGCPVGSPNALFFRSGHIGYYDLLKDDGVMHFSAQRPGCWINFVFGNGLVMVPEASSGCMCPFANMCTVVFSPAPQTRAWAKYSMSGPMTPVKRLAVNLGAPGDRKDDAGTLWLAYPRPRGSLVLDFKLDIQNWSGAGWLRETPDFTEIAGTANPWLYTFGYRGAREIEIPLIEPGEGPARYTVRLHFAETEGAEAGRRVFDVKLQGRTALEDIDIAREGGGAGRALVKEIRGIDVADKLVIGMQPKAAEPASDQVPLLQAIDIEREEVLAAGLLCPTVVLNDTHVKRSAEVHIANFKSTAFEGTLTAAPPAGFVVSPSSMSLHLAPGTKRTVSIQAALAGSSAEGVFPCEFRLLRADGSVEARQTVDFEYIGRRDRIVLQAIEDAYVAAARPGVNLGASPTLLVDGGHREMGDESHHIGYLKFLLDVPGTILSAKLRLFNAGNPTSDGGNVRLVTEPWQERKITYNNRPKAGELLGNLGRIEPDQVVELPLAISLDGKKELSLVIDPVNLDGVDYYTREGGKPAELEIEFEREE